MNFWLRIEDCGFEPPYLLSIFTCSCHQKFKKLKCFLAMTLISFHFNFYMVIFHLNYFMINSITFHIHKIPLNYRHLKWYSPLKIMTTIPFWYWQTLVSFLNSKYWFTLTANSDPRITKTFVYRQMNGSVLS